MLQNSDGVCTGNAGLSPDLPSLRPTMPGRATTEEIQQNFKFARQTRCCEIAVIRLVLKLKLDGNQRALGLKCLLELNDNRLRKGNSAILCCALYFRLINSNTVVPSSPICGKENKLIFSIHLFHIMIPQSYFSNTNQTHIAGKSDCLLPSAIK